MNKIKISIRRTTTRLQLLAMAIALIGFVECKKNDDGPAPIKEVAKSSAKEISGFEFSVPDAMGTMMIFTGVIDDTAKTIAATLPSNTDLTALAPEVTTSEKAGVSPTGAQDFTGPIAYTVTAEDGSTAIYTATITLALTQMEILQAILDANPNNTLGWDLENTPADQLNTLSGVDTNLEGAIYKLGLTDRKIPQLPPEIGQLTSLKELFLGDNHLKGLPTEFSELVNLQVLDLYVNDLTRFPSEIFPLSKLEKLRVSSNQISVLPSEIGQLTSLITLTLSSNLLAALPSEIGQLTNLEELNIFNNLLTSLPSEIGQLSALKELYAPNNNIGSLPEELYQLTNLERLNLSSNSISSISLEIGMLTNLDELELDNNSIGSIPQEIGKLINLGTLNIEGNNITSLPPEIGFLTNLNALYMSGNTITTMPIAICNLRDFHGPMTFQMDNTVACGIVSETDVLVSLYNSNVGNTIEWGVDNYPDVGFKDNGKVRTITLNNKGLTAIPSYIDQLTELESLTMSNNPLGDSGVPASIGNINTLLGLFLSSTNITTVPSEFGQLSNLALLVIRDNPITSIPQSVCNLQTSNGGMLSILTDSGACN